MQAKEMAQARQQSEAMAGQEAQLEKMQEQQRQQEEMAERKRMMVRQILEPEAFERLVRVGLVKPMRRAQIEDALLAMAQKGALQERMSDSALVNLIDRVDGPSASTSKVNFQRKRRDDEDDDLDLDNL
eukprot:TRINITY_DN71749_c0_g1_i1.p1 TRINITY_DN71749_c0_g1~~TRINITY_DN71749_c0_g1_i1.p1  ORF type:complete len:129 (+),score=39.44 TRINITY_DN71749_c0_g1_i1:92-478(+)